MWGEVSKVDLHRFAIVRADNVKVKGGGYQTMRQAKGERRRESGFVMRVRGVQERIRRKDKE
jgi:hypothetical protein